MTKTYQFSKFIKIRVPTLHKYLHINQTTKYYRLYYCPQNGNVEIGNVL